MRNCTHGDFYKKNGTLDVTIWRLIVPHALCIYPVAQMRKLKYISAVIIGETNTLNLKLIRSQL